MIEVRSNITQNLNKGCRLWQQPRLESELLETKQRSFWFDVSRWNQVSRMETQQSRIECQLTFERYGSLCRFNYYSSSPNGLLTQSPWGWEEWFIVLVSLNMGLSAGTGKLCIFGHLGLVFIWSCFVSCLLLLLYYVICAPVLTEGTLNIIIMWGGVEINFCFLRGGVWLSFGAYFTHFPAPPPPSRWLLHSPLMCDGRTHKVENWAYFNSP